MPGHPCFQVLRRPSRLAVLLLIGSSLAAGEFLCPWAEGAWAQDAGWQTALFSQPGAVLNLLNGSAPYTTAAAEAKVCAYKSGDQEWYRVFYRTGAAGSAATAWGWKAAYSADDVVRFLNGTGPYGSPVSEAMVCGLWTGAQPKFVVFHRSGGEAPMGQPWTWLRTTSADAVLRTINGYGEFFPKGRFEVVSLYRGGRDFYLFYKPPAPHQARDLWTLERFSSSLQVRNHLNASWTPGPLLDGKMVTVLKVGDVYEYCLFKPQGLLVLTRPMFAEAEMPGEEGETVFEHYAKWKRELGLETYVLTAEWAREIMPGTDLREQIRNCLRTYHNGNGIDAGRAVRYAMLVGDSVPEIKPEPPLPCFVYEGIDRFIDCGYPSEPELSENWNLPAGYIRISIRSTGGDQGGLIWTTSYWADLDGKDDYYNHGYTYEGEYRSGPDQDGFAGNYGIRVGVVPVKTVAELVKVVNKSMTYEPTRDVHLVASEEFDQEHYFVTLYTIVLALVNPYVSPEIPIRVDQQSPARDEVDQAIFKQPGVLRISAHGDVDSFLMSNHLVSGRDGATYVFEHGFDYVNPAFLLTSCGVHLYTERKEGLMEDWLRARKGPAVIMRPVTYEGWLDLLLGKPVGDAYYGHLFGQGLNPENLYGDPSLVLFGPSW